MENLYTQMYEHYVQRCKEQKVDAKDIKFKFEVGKSYLDTNYGIYVREGTEKEFWLIGGMWMRMVPFKKDNNVLGNGFLSMSTPRE